MTQLVNTTAHAAARQAARQAASLALADAGAGNSSVRLYTAAGGTLLAVRTLSKPCGTVGAGPDHRITLAWADTAEVALATGAATWGEWCNGSGVAISAGRVTDPDGNYTDGTGAVVPDPAGVGPFVLGGSTGTMVYAGGLVLLYAGLIG
ncbi:MAG: hypothetical protein Q8S71_11970 [Hydrogenophaga sp.]|nr:hypothetical protein [Hydrogenophaga sp.]